MFPESAPRIQRPEGFSRIFLVGWTGVPLPAGSPCQWICAVLGLTQLAYANRPVSPYVNLPFDFDESENKRGTDDQEHSGRNQESNNSPLLVFFRRTAK